MWINKFHITYESNNNNINNNNNNNKNYVIISKNCCSGKTEHEIWNVRWGYSKEDKYI